MHQPRGDLHLGQITTLWSIVRAGHASPNENVAAAQQLLLERHGGAITRYLKRILRTVDEAEKLYQEFVLHFLRGDFRGANPTSGRFRDYVKTVLFHLVGQHQTAASAGTDVRCEEAFLDSWRKELLARAWDRLAQIQLETRRPVYAILRFRVDHPDMAGAQLAERVSALLGKPLTEPATRQALHRARVQLSELLLESVQDSLDRPTPERLEQELLDLNLFHYCQPILERRHCS